MKIISTLLLLVSFTLYSYQVHSDETVYVGLRSHHFEQCDTCRSGEWNEQNNLIGYSDDKWFIGYMKNSWDNDSILLGRRWWEDITPHVRTFATLGLATGYPKSVLGPNIGNLRVMGMIGLEIHTKDKRFGVIIATIPGHVIAIGPKFGF